MTLVPALALLAELHAALAEEIGRAREERLLLRTLDATLLLDRAARRQQFNARAAALEQKLAAELARAAAAAGLPDATIAGLAKLGGPEGPQLAQALGELRALATALGELDVLNHHLAARTLKVVRGYTAALVARPSAYDRLGRNLAATGT